MMRDLETIELDVTREKLLRYAILSDDFNPIHVDPEFAASTSLGGVIAHGTLSLNLVLDSIDRTFGPPITGTHEVDVRFLLPVREGDVVQAGGSPAADGSFSVWVRNQHGAAVIEGSARLALPPASQT